MTAPVRAGTFADLDAVMDIERASFPTDAWSVDAMRETFATGDAFVAESDDGIVGYAAVLAPQGSGDADVLTIAVTAAHRGKGIGAALLEHMLETASMRGAHRVFLEVRADNPVAQRLYASRGFAVVGRRPRYYQPDGVDAIVMRLDLGEAR
ncbi:ribosomal protein S18-alanine N-acetyltransferase [Amnibacterium kyonggiense]|uniref:[Ribosomal protein bS18]-alanine N-acetyltransferase n=1 Tax=Amnibacterium kyonggiense TaxID=595671 RepID=A0A4R7FQU7_9MICO|nr:ribosomal protein S18-alanine N-acetyltransferase [Amnibacterium kyonggiense]TDS80171.1 ribosomal-protein-alanine N-acetyltransferase [Amnibacterium kyonggiense]